MDCPVACALKRHPPPLRNPRTGLRLRVDCRVREVRCQDSSKQSKAKQSKAKQRKQGSKPARSTNTTVYILYLSASPFRMVFFWGIRLNSPLGVPHRANGPRVPAREARRQASDLRMGRMGLPCDPRNQSWAWRRSKSTWSLHDPLKMGP